MHHTSLTTPSKQATSQRSQPSSTPLFQEFSSVGAHLTRTRKLIDPLIAEELRDSILGVDYTRFLEHALGCPASLAEEWSAYFSELRECPEIEGYLKALSEAKTETKRYSPFADMANFILDKTRDKFPLPDTALPDLRFSRCDPTVIKGPPESNTPSRKPDVVLVRKPTADRLAKKEKASVFWAEILCAIEFKVAQKCPGNTPEQDDTLASILTGHSSKLKRKASSALSDGTPATKRSRTETPTGSIHTSGSGLADGDFKQLSSYPLEILSSTSGTREHAISMMVDEYDMQLWFYDHAGAIYCDFRINFSKDFVQFATVISACARLSGQQFGVLSFVDFPSPHDIPTSLKNATLAPQDVDGIGHSVTFTGEIISSRPGIVGRCSVVCGAVCDSVVGSSDLVVKLSFQDVTRKSEIDIVRHATAMGVSFLPWIHLWQDFPRLSQGVRGRLVPDENGVSKYEDRVLRVMVSTRYIPVYKLPALSDFQTVIRDIFECMNQLRVRARILHRDISYTNIMAKKLTDGSFQGVLNDFDLAVQLDEISAEGHSSLHRTGTLPFMAYELLTDQPIVHEFRHDVESLFYVLVWITAQFDANCRYEACEALETWHKGHIDDMRAAKGDFIIQALRLSTLELNSFYNPLKTTWLQPLRNIFLPLHTHHVLSSQGLKLAGYLPPTNDGLFNQISTILNLSAEI